MAVQQNSLKYFGGQQSGGDSSARQVVIERTDMTAAFTEDEYQKCLSAISLGYAVAVSWGTGSSKMQAQLSLMMADGSLHFAITLVDLEMVFIVDGGSPHSITAHTNDLGSDQFVLLRTDMVTNFTDDEYQDCVDGVTSGKAVCVQYGSNQVQLASVSGGALYFNGCSLTENFQYVVSPTVGDHTITRTSAPIGGSGGDQFVLVRTAMATAFSNQEYQDCIDAVTAGKAVCVQFSRVGIKHQAQLTSVDSSNNLIFELDSEVYHFKWEVQSTNNNHLISERIFHFGTPIFGSLQDAISESDSLEAGMYFETNGFYASGDGGAARYVVSSTGTANGMDIVQLDAGKLAILQVNANREMFPEQFGYKRDSNRYDLTPYLVRMTTMPSTPVRNIRLMPTGSSSAVYVMRTTWNITAADVSIIGHSGFSTGHATQVWFLPDSYGTDYTPMFKFGQRGFVMKNLVLFNRPWFADGNKHNCVCLYMAISNTNKMWYDFDQLAIQGFDIGIAKVPPTGDLSDGLIWHCEFHRLAMSLNNKNVYFHGLSYVTKFDNCFLTVNDSGAISVTLEESFSTEFDRCNFGIYSPAVTILFCQDYIVSGKAVDVRWAQCKLTNCNFELEYDDSHPLPTNTSGFFVKCEDHDDFNLEFNNCCFIATPLARNDIYSDRLVRLGAKTKAIFRQCAGPYVDVNHTGNEYYDWTFKKYFFDENHPPKKELGSLLLEHCIGIMAPPNNAWGSVYLPVVKDDTIECPLSDNNTKFVENYPTVSDGIILVNLDKANLEVKLGASMVQVTSPGTGKIRIGDRIYDYVTIDGRKWITTNLQLWTMNTRQWHFPDHEEFGFYYGIETFPEVDALLPAGWRRPNYADCQSIISQGCAAVQALGQSAFPNATNTTGLSVLPCYRWVKPNTSVTFNRGFFWGPEEVGVGWHAVNVQAANISYAGWPYSDANGLKIPLRVCCDA